MSAALVVFVSGHLSVTPEEFELHYVPLLKHYLALGYTFVVGDARGADTLAQNWLKAQGASVVVFHMHKKPRNNAGFPLRGGFKSDLERDAAMTAASDLDAAWVRPGREQSGTADNLRRRVEKNAS